MQDPQKPEEGQPDAAFQIDPDDAGEREAPQPDAGGEDAEREASVSDATCSSYVAADQTASQP